MSHEPTPLEVALDLLVYVPVGFALTVGEEVPKLAAKGRARLGGHLVAARMVGQFAVGQGRRKMDQRVSRPSPEAARTAAASAQPQPAQPQPAQPQPAQAKPQPAPAPEDVVAPGANRADSTSLAIPGYDSLSASQVVQRLAGLSALELEAVRHYELAGRGRRTVLARITQLQGT